MKRFVLMIISSCAMLFAYAQEEIVLDSISKIRNVTEARQLIPKKPTVFDDSFSKEGFHMVDKSMFNPLHFSNFSKNPDFSKQMNQSKISSESFSIQGFGFSRFYSTGAIFNQVTYRLNDRLSFGGNSFGAQSVFEQPKMNSTIQDMSMKGASVFMQFKISDKFKVETRVSIYNQQSPAER